MKQQHDASIKSLRGCRSTLGAILGCLLIGGCHSVEVSGGPQVIRGPVVSPTPPPVQETVDLDGEVTVTQPWNIVFVSQDGPKGHENIAAQACSEVVWCHMWQRVQQTGQALGVDLELAYVTEDCAHEDACVRQQIRLLDGLVKRGNIDGLIIGPRDSNLLVPVIESAIANNIAVIAMGTPINSPNVLTLVNFDDIEGGKTIGQWVSQRLQGQGNVVIIEGPKYQKNALDRRRGILSGLQGTDITVLDTATALWSCRRAQALTQKWLRKFPNIDAIIAASDHMALGALIATHQANRTDILITGYDAMPLAQAAIAEGRLAATMQQFPRTTSPTALKLMVRHLETGETFPPVVYLPKPRLMTTATLNRQNRDSLPNLDINTLDCNA